MVGVLINIWSVVVGSWSVVCGLWSVAGRWFCTTPLQNIPCPNSNLSIEMSTYRQSFPSFAASNDDNPTGLFAGATFQNCAFTFGSLVA